MSALFFIFLTQLNGNLDMFLPLTLSNAPRLVLRLALKCSLLWLLKCPTSPIEHFTMASRSFFGHFLRMKLRRRLRLGSMLDFGQQTSWTKTYHETNWFPIIMCLSNGPIVGPSKAPFVCPSNGPLKCFFEWTFLCVKVWKTVC